jgi:hypothetical protein
MAVQCSHLDAIEIVDPPSHIEGCEECLKAGSWWVHLRMCQSCGHIGCCDSSPGRHATKHAVTTDHPIMRSVEPGEDWSWCVVDQVMFVVRPAAEGAQTFNPRRA